MSDKTGRLPPLPRTPPKLAPEMAGWFRELEQWLTAAREVIEEPTDAEPPTFAQLTSLGVAFFTGEIDGTVAAATTIGTVPAGKCFASLGTYVITQSVDSSSGSVLATIKIDNGSLVVRSAVACGNANARNFVGLGGGTANNTVLDSGGSTIVVTVTVAATCPAITLVVGTFGLLFDV